MKKPTFNPAALGGFFLHHGEKLAFAAIGGFALLLAWWGIDAIRSQAVKPDRKPDAVASLAGQATANIDSVRKVPAERLPSRQPLEPVIDPWRPGQVKIAAAPTSGALLNRPLVAELSKRTKPDVFPIEDLRAVAGIAVLPDPMAQVGGAQAVRRQPDLTPPGEDARRKPPRSKPKGRQQAGDESAFGLGGGLGGELVEPAAAEPQQPGKITPFVVVTGLIPAAKQQQEYDRRFGSASFRDPRRDSPKWGVYLVERARVVPGGSPRWERLEVKNTPQPQPGGRIGMGEMPGGPGEGQQPLQAETLPPAFFLGAEEAEAEYAAALPQRIDEPWGAVGVHPWFVPRIEEFLTSAAGEEVKPANGLAAKATLADLLEDSRKRVGTEILLESVTLDAEPERQRNVGLYKFGVRSTKPVVAIGVGEIGVTGDPVFAVSEQWVRQLSVDGTTAEPRACNLRCRVDIVGKTPVIRILQIELLDAGGEPGETRTEPVPQPVVMAAGQQPMGPLAGGEPGRAIAAADNRLFRFVDTTVKPGETYRYRVKFALRNPNVDLAARHVADVAAAKGEFLISEYSTETSPVRVPDPVVIVTRTIDKDTKKKMKVKGEAIEVMILAPSDKTGNFALRSTLTDVGGLANVAPELNKAGDVRFFGEPVTTDRLLVAAHGPQDDRADLRSITPPEPLELLFLKPDGSFDIVTAADGERQVRRYGDTLFKPGTRVPDDGRPDRREREDQPGGP
jgi:hypothetical protein